jgi:predicted ribosome quality control (RQC) complex YloA/Tae2 family protein
LNYCTTDEEYRQEGNKKMTADIFDLNAQIEQLKRRLNQLIQKNTKKLQKQQEELSEAQKNLWYKQIGDSLLSIPAGIIKRGSSQAQITNIYSQQTETIPLNPKLDIHENVQLLYKKAKRAKRGEEINGKKVEVTQNEIKKLNELSEELENCDIKIDEERLKKITTDLESLLSPKSSEQHSPNSSPGIQEKTPYRYFHTEGWDIYIGKNDAQNDELSTRFARPSDVWLHVAGHAGSHVVIKRPKDKEMPPRDILETAASLAIWFSKAKHTSYAEVNYTEARFVHKRRHAPAGEVIAERCKSVRVSPRSPQDLFRMPFLED